MLANGAGGGRGVGPTGCVGRKDSADDTQPAAGRVTAGTGCTSASGVSGCCDGCGGASGNGASGGGRGGGVSNTAGAAAAGGGKTGGVEGRGSDTPPPRVVAFGCMLCDSRPWPKWRAL